MIKSNKKKAFHTKFMSESAQDDEVGSVMDQIYEKFKLSGIMTGGMGTIPTNSQFHAQEDLLKQLKKQIISKSLNADQNPKDIIKNSANKVW